MVSQPFILFNFILKSSPISAILHGYDYLRITAPPIPGLGIPWVKIPHLYDIIHKYDIIVCFDPDVYLRHSNISVEFLMKRYNFTDKSSFLMAMDPNGKDNEDSQGRTVLNTGFIIAQNNNLTKQILKRLALCTVNIPGCEKWKYKWSHEQRAFNDYLRDQMKVGSELIIAPCDEVNGYDGSNSGCTGKLLVHAWIAKDTINKRVQKVMLETLMMILEKEMWENKHVSVALTSDIEKLGDKQ
jgi:hypothetical protein